MPDVFTEPLENNYFKCCRKCVVILKKWSLTHFCLLSLLFAVNRTATVGRLELLGCLSVYRLDTEPSPDQLSAVAKSHHILTNWVHYLGGILHLPAKCGQCFGWCCKVFTWNDWTGSELLFIIFQEKKRLAGKKLLNFGFAHCWMWKFPVLYTVVALLSPNPLLLTHHWYVNGGQLVWQYNTVTATRKWHCCILVWCRTFKCIWSLTKPAKNWKYRCFKSIFSK